MTPIKDVEQFQIYMCDVCNKSFDTKIAIKAHIRCVHGKFRLKCTECNKHFRCQQYLKNHMQVVHSQEQCKCKICGKVLKCKKILANHRRLVHHIKTIGNASRIQCNTKSSMTGVVPCLTQTSVYKCDECKKSFETKEAIRSHLMCVHGTSRLKCPECNKPFSCQQYLQNHIRVVHSQEQCKCKICGKVLKCRKTLDNHMKFVHHVKTRIADSPSVLYKCKYCMKKFLSKDRQMSHRHKIHRDPENKNYRCDKCFKTFQSKIAFMSHHKYEYETERYKCIECNREYKRKTYLQIHINTVHGNREFECDICKKIFKYKDGIKRHILRLHCCRSSDLPPCLPTVQVNVQVQRTYLRSSVPTVKSEPVDAKLELDPISDIKPCLLLVPVRFPRTYSRLSFPKKTVKSTLFISSRAQEYGAQAVKSEPFHAEIKPVWNQINYPCSSFSKNTVVGTNANQYSDPTVKSEPADTDLELSSVNNLQPLPPKIQLCIQRNYSRSSFSKNTAVSTSSSSGFTAIQHSVEDLKLELTDELEVGPVMFQHMDYNYKPKEELQNDSCNSNLTLQRLDETTFCFHPKEYF